MSDEIGVSIVAGGLLLVLCAAPFLHGTVAGQERLRLLEAHTRAANAACQEQGGTVETPFRGARVCALPSGEILLLEKLGARAP